MLRVTEIINESNRVELKLEGRIVGDCIDYLQEVCLQFHEKGLDEVMLDFSGIRYVEYSGVMMLKSLMENKVRIKNCPIFIDELLKNNI
jgi:anti-anti-sigma regulatory factor